MRLKFLLCIYALAAITLTGKGDATHDVSGGSVKAAIIEKRREVDKALSADRGELLKELAILYLNDQDQEHAFESFIAALEAVHPRTEDSLPDNSVYEEALSLYFKNQSGSPQETAVLILEKYSSSPPQGPIGYLLALSYANLDKYSDFFGLFYDTFLAYPQNYLADKTRAILYIKLFERTGTVEKRESIRKAILANLACAEIKEPRDISIYKLKITFSPTEEKSEIVSRCLNKIIADNIIIPRSEIQFYVQHAVDARQKGLAQQFIDKARQWHSSSRIIDTAQKFLDSSLENSP